MNDKEQLYILANLAQVQPTKLAIRLFFTRILVVVCGLWWFVIVCGGLSYSHTRQSLSDTDSGQCDTHSVTESHTVTVTVSFDF